MHDAFPFGRPHRRTPPHRPEGKAVAFLVGVYSSAIHAAWYGPDGRRLCQALAVDIEPHSFWNGSDADHRVREIASGVPREAGRLEPADPKFNGPSGVTVDQLYFVPLGLRRQDCWLTDLHDQYYLSPGNAAAIKKHYDPMAVRLGLPQANLPKRPSTVSADKSRLAQLEAEFVESGAELIITLGNEPLATLFPGGPRKLEVQGYGERRDALFLGQHPVAAIHLCHPRQAGGLGQSTLRWTQAHADWVVRVRSRGGR